MTNSNVITSHQLANALQQQLPDTQSEWLFDASKKICSEPASQDTQLLLSAIANRQLSSEILQDLPGTWTSAEAARVLLLQTYIDNVQNKSNKNYRYDAIWHAYRRGDENEKTAYIKGLSLLDPEGEVLDIALHTGRTNNVQLFSAIALHNAYPAKHYDNNAIEQLVLKTLFLNLNINRIDALQQRLQTTLSSKCMDLVRERLAANREPPVSIWLAINIQHLNDEAQALFLKFLSDPIKEHRYYSLLALKQLDLLTQYQEHFIPLLKTETEPAIRQLLTNLTD